MIFLLVTHNIKFKNVYSMVPDLYPTFPKSPPPFINILCVLDSRRPLTVLIHQAFSCCPHYMA